MLILLQLSSVIKQHGYIFHIQPCGTVKTHIKMLNIPHLITVRRLKQLFLF